MTRIVYIYIYIYIYILKYINGLKSIRSNAISKNRLLICIHIICIAREYLVQR